MLKNEKLRNQLVWKILLLKQHIDRSARSGRANTKKGSRRLPFLVLVLSQELVRAPQFERSEAPQTARSAAPKG